LATVSRLDVATIGYNEQDVMNLKDREWSHDASHGGIEDVVAQESTAKVGHVGLPKQDNPAICYPFV